MLSHNHLLLSLLDLLFPVYIQIYGDIIYYIYLELTIVGCAFLKFETKEQALAAIEGLNGKHKMEVCANSEV